MKKTLFISFLILITFWQVQPLAQDSPDELTLMSFNIRMDTDADGADAWSLRKPLTLQVIQKYKPDILGMQEVLYRQLTWLHEKLPEYSFVGVGRDDGKAAGEYSPIFYNSSELIVINSGTFWLSTTPEVIGSKDWDAAITRICTWAIFEIKSTGQKFAVFNTHFDHRGKEARLQSAKVILSKAEKLAPDLPTILMGDFNATPDSPPIQAITNSGFSSGAERLHGPDWTFHGFTGTGTSGNIIDFIFHDSRWSIMSYIHCDDHAGERWPSDHLPVLATIKTGNF